MKENKLIAFIAPTPAGMFPHGTHNGYVAVPPEHPCFRGSYLEKPVCDLEVHGGITYSEPVCAEETTFMSKRAFKPECIGMRNPLLNDVEYLTEEKDIPDDWWILGFDTCHFGDNLIKWNKQSVIAETLRLKEQLKTLANNAADNPQPQQ